jgi:esterase
LKLNVHRFGSGPQFVLLHGLFGAGENLRSVARALQDEYEVILPDLPNHGESPHTENATYSVMVDSVTELLASLTQQGEERVILGGHSMGGKVAMQVALEQSGLIRGLVALDIAPRSYEPSHIELMDALLGLDLDSVESRGDADKALEAAIPSGPVRSFLLTNLVKEDNRYRWRINLPALKRDYQNILSWQGIGQYAGPSLFLGGDRSKYLKPDRDRERIQSHFPEATVSVIKDAGHWIHADQRDQVVEHLRSFLASLPP